MLNLHEGDGCNVYTWMWMGAWWELVKLSGYKYMACINCMVGYNLHKICIKTFLPSLYFQSEIVALMPTSGNIFTVMASNDWLPHNEKVSLSLGIIVDNRVVRCGGTNRPVLIKCGQKDSWACWSDWRCRCEWTNWCWHWEYTCRLQISENVMMLIEVMWLCPYILFSSSHVYCHMNWTFRRIT